MEQKRSGCLSFLVGAILGGATSIVVSAYFTRDLGDSPGIGLGQLSLAFISTVSGGAAFSLIMDVSAKGVWSVRRAVRAVVFSILILPSIYYSYQFANSMSEFRLRHVNRYTHIEIRNYKQNLMEYIAKTGKRPDSLEVMKKFRTNDPETVPMYQGLEVDYNNPSKHQSDNFLLRMHHKKGNQEFALSQDTYEIYWRNNNERDWKKIADDEDVSRDAPTSH